MCRGIVVFVCVSTVALTGPAVRADVVDVALVLDPDAGTFDVMAAACPLATGGIASFNVQLSNVDTIELRAPYLISQDLNTMELTDWGFTEWRQAMAGGGLGWIGAGQKDPNEDPNVVFGYGWRYIDLPVMPADPWALVQGYHPPPRDPNGLFCRLFPDHPSCQGGDPNDGDESPEMLWMGHGDYTLEPDFLSVSVDVYTADGVPTSIPAGSITTQVFVIPEPTSLAILAPTAALWLRRRKRVT